MVQPIDTIRQNTGIGSFNPFYIGFRPNVALVVGDSILGGGWSSGTATATSSGTTVTGTWVGHPLFPGSIVTISGANENEYNGIFVVTSIASNNFTYTALSTPSAATATGTLTAVCNHRVTNRNFFAIANAALGWPIDRIYCAAISGTTSSQAVASFNTLQPPGQVPDVVVIQTGTNDILNITLAQSKINIQSLVDSSFKLGARVILCTIPPNTGFGWSAAQIQNALNLNDWIRRLATSDTRITLCDTFTALADPNVTTNAYLTNYGKSDNIHPSDYGSQKTATKSMIPALKNLIPGILLANPFGRYVHTRAEDANVNANSLQLVTNPMMNGTQVNPGTGTGNTPTSWTGNKGGTATNLCSVATRSDGYGQNAVMTITSGAANDNGEMLGTNISSKVTTGDTLQMEVQVAGSSLPATFDYLEASIDFTQGGASYFVRAIHRSGDTPGWVDDFDYVFRTLPFTLTGTVTNLQPRIKINFNGTATTVPFTVARCAIRKIN